MELKQSTYNHLARLIKGYDPYIPTSYSQELESLANGAPFIVFKDPFELEIDERETVISLFHILHHNPVQTDSKGRSVKKYKLGELPKEQRYINPIGNKQLDKLVDPDTGIYVGGLSDKNYRILLWMKNKGVLNPMQGVSARIYSTSMKNAIESLSDASLTDFLKEMLTPDMQAVLQEEIRLGSLPEMFEIHQTSRANPDLQSNDSLTDVDSDYLRTLVSKDEIPKVIRMLQNFTNRVNISDTLIILNSRWIEVKKQERLDLASSSDIRTEKNRIRAALLEII